jgi:MarR family transcriptional regulator, organic hydroperoxide resistance regulator
MAKKKSWQGKQVELCQLALELEQHLTAIRQEIRRPVEAEFAKGGLTGPQRSVMQALFNSEGRSLKELTSQVGLAHSTVSGIVDRLEKRGLIERKPNLNDRRHTRIIASGKVREFMEKRYPAIAAHPLFDVLRAAEATERNAILTGIRTLRRLLDKQHQH